MEKQLYIYKQESTGLSFYATQEIGNEIIERIMKEDSRKWLITPIHPVESVEKFFEVT